MANDLVINEVRWLLKQQAAGKVGFDDLIAITQVKLPLQATLERVRNCHKVMEQGHENAISGFAILFDNY